MLTPFGADYPPRLRDLEAPPFPLYVTGELPRGPAVAVVGTRVPTTEACEFARGFACRLAEAGITVVSGGAAGIDTAAHEGALDGGGATVVVAPAAFDRPYPTENASLFDRVVRSGGAYVTAYPAGTSAMQHHFFVRNAHLAALSDALVVVESRLRGGARNAAKAARHLSRPVFVVPGAPWNANAHGCLEELRLGASWVASAEELLATLGFSTPASSARSLEVDEPQSSRPASPDLPQSCSGDPDRDSVLKAVRNGPRTAEELCSLTGLPAGRLHVLILTLTLEGIVVSDPAGFIRLGRH